MKKKDLYVTYCSRRKRKAPGQMPALDRYRSARIRAVARAAERDGASFRILSGKYGLIAADRRIPDYDHLLKPGEVATMARKVAARLRGYQRVVFWHDPADYQTPYRKVMRAAALAAGVKLAMQTWRAAPKKAAKAAVRNASAAAGVGDGQFDAIFQQHQAVMLLIEPDSGRIVAANDAALRFYGYTRGQITALTVQDINTLPPEEVAAQRRRALREGLHKFVFPHRLASGAVRTVEVYSSPVEVRGRTLLFSIIHDITNRLLAEELLRDNKARYVALFNGMSGGVAVYRARNDGEDFYFVDINPAGARLSNVDREQVIGESVLKLFPAIKEMGLFAVFQQVWRTGVYQHHPVTLYRDKRITQWVENHVYKLPSGEIVALFDDVTAQRRAETELRVSEERYRELAEGMPVYITTFLPDGRLLYVNSALAEATGMEPGKMVGLNYFNWLPPDEMRALQLRLAKLTPEQPAETHEQIHRQPDGNARKMPDGTFCWQQWTNRAFFDANREPVRYQAIGLDITVRKRAENALREASEFNRAVLAQAASGIVVYDRAVRIVVWNNFMERITGVPAVGVLGQPALDLFPHLREQGVDRLIRRAMAGETIKSPDTPFYIPQTGNRGWVVSHYAPQRDSGGEIVGVIATVRDITERKQLEQQLRESGEMFRSLFEHSPIIIAIHDKDSGEILEANPAALKSFGMTDLVQLQANDFWLAPPYSGAEALVLVRKVYSAGEQHFEWPNRRSNGELFWTDVRLNAITINGVPRVLATAVDITQRRWMEEQLRASEEKYRALVEHAQEAIFVVRDGIIRFVNASFARIAGIPENMAVGRTITSFLPEEEHARQLAHHERVISGEEVGTEIFPARMNGARRWLQVSSTRILWQDLPATLNLATDITERRQAEQYSREQARLLDLIFAHAQDGVVLLDRDYNFVRVNASYAKSCGKAVADFPGKNHFAMYPSNLKDEFDAALRAGQVYNRNARPFTFPDHPEWGTTYWDLGLVPIRDESGEIELLLFTLKDVSDRKRADEALIHSERLAAVGQLAAGVAHEFNNLLGAIRNHAYSIRSAPGLADNVTVLEKAVAIEAQTMRGSEVARGMMNLARPTPPHLRPLAVAELVEEVLRVQRDELAGEGVEVEQEIPVGLHVKGDAGKLQQVLLNLVINARHAMQPQGGKLTLRAVAGVHEVRLAVADTGCGVSKENMPKLFLPFFTTKGGFADNDLGLRGEGLGLAVCQTIMRDHGGSIEVESEPGKGSCFTLIFPA